MPKLKTSVVNITPTWSAVLPTLLLLLEAGNADARRVAKDELKNMARAADLYNSPGPAGRTQKPAQARASELPDLAYVAVPGKQVLCIVKRGARGYYTTDFPAGQDPEAAAARLNQQMGVTPAQASAMVNGSICGWDVPAADPANILNRTAARAAAGRQRRRPHGQ